MSTDPTYPLFSIFAFLGFILPLIPLPWHLRAWNSGTVYYMLWASLACLNQFVNSIVWAGNALNPAPVWCDISTRIIMGASVGLPSASLCINRRLYKIASSQAVSTTRAEKRRAILIDTLICVLWPLIYMALQYIVQGHRFNIFEDIGCYPALYNTIPMFFISSIWPIVLGLISAVYCVLSLRAFARRRIEFSQFLSTNKSLTMGRYFRLMALAMTEMLCTTPLAIFSIWLDTVATPVEPWVSWKDTHLDFSRVEQIPTVFWRSSHIAAVTLEFTRWTAPACALVFFAFFGFAEESRRHYRMAYLFIRRKIGFPVATKKNSPPSDFSGQFKKFPPSPGGIPSTPSLPAYSLPSTPTSPSSLPAYDAKLPRFPTKSLEKPARSPSLDSNFRTSSCDSICTTEVSATMHPYHTLSDTTHSTVAPEDGFPRAI